MKEDCDVDDLVDVIEGSRVYIPCIYVINKIDQARQPLSGFSCIVFENQSYLLFLVLHALFRAAAWIFLYLCYQQD